MNSEILRLSEIYGAARRLKESSVSTYATGSGDMLSRLRGTDERRPADITTRRAARIIQWLADNWPADAPWPPDIPRPSPSPGAPAARPEGAAPDAPAEGPVAYVRACRDRRLDRIDAGDWEGAKAIQLDMMRVAERLRADGRIACPMALAVALGVPRKVVDDTIRRYRDGRDGGAPRRRSRYDDALAALARSGDVRFASRRLKGRGMKHSDYILTGTARNLGRIDGTTRDTWIATVRIASADGGYATEHSGTGKDPRVAFRRAAGDALDALDSQSGDARERRRGVPMTGSVPRHDGELYPMPASGWTCFHCGETFFSIGTARDHFGHDPDATPACRLSPEHVRLELRRYRFLETELRAVLDELVDVRALGDGAPFLSHDSDRVYGLITRAIEAIAEDRLVGGLMSASAHAWIACEICGRAHSRDAPCPYPPGRHRGSGVNGVLVEGDGAALVRGRTRLRHWLGDMSGPERESFGHGHHLLSSAGLDSASPMAPSEGSAS